VSNDADIAELVAWGQLCAKGFSHRGGDPSRFYRKLQADPSAHRKWIRIVVNREGAMVGTCRLFDRAFEVDHRPAVCVGLGEVCTDPDQRGKGIANVILSDATRFMDALHNSHVSLLHAAAAVAGLYARYGYTPLRVPYGILSPLPSDAPESPKFTYRMANWETDVPAFSRIHRAFAARIRVGSVLLRDDAYWRRWMPNVAGGMMQVAELRGSIVGYGCVLFKPDGFKLADFAVDDAIDHMDAKSVLHSFVRRGIDRLISASGGAGGSASAPTSTASAPASATAPSGAAPTSGPTSPRRSSTAPPPGTVPGPVKVCLI
jgi:predicted GNAT family N-acyltransferase